MNWEIQALHIDKLWNLGLTGKGVRIGHLDTGIDGKHSAFRHSLKAFKYFDRDGFPKSKQKAKDENGHGTHTAGIIAASPSPNYTTSGIAPKASLYSAAVIEAGSTLIRMIYGLQWLMKKKVQIINISVGVQGWNPILRPIIRQLWQNGILPISVIGNDNVGRFRSPGCYPEVFSVGAINETGKIPQFSGSLNEGIICLKPDVLAPGVSITAPKIGGGLKTYSGTSSAGAICSGVAALLLEAFPTTTPHQLAIALEKSAKTTPNQQEHRSRNGCIQPLKAYQELKKQFKAQPKSWLKETNINQPIKIYRDPTVEKKLTWVDDDYFLEIIVYRHPTLSVKMEQIIQEHIQRLNLRPRRLRYLPKFGLAILLISKRFIKVLLADKRLEMISHSVGKIPVWGYSMNDT